MKFFNGYGHKLKVIRNLAILTMTLFFSWSIPVEAAKDLPLEFDLQSMEGELNQLFPEYHIDMDVLFQHIMKGEIKEGALALWENISGGVGRELAGMKSLLSSILIMGIISALFTSLGDLFSGKQIAQVGFYMVYLIMIALLTKAFAYASETAAGTIENIVTFIKLFIPTYFIAVGTAVGVTTATVYYQFILVVIYGVEVFLTSVLMPFIYCYVILSLINGVWTEEKLAFLLDLMKKGAAFALKLSIGVITGISLLQSIITPAVDKLKTAGFQKAVSMIPGVGSFAEGVFEMVIGSAALIKNSLGVLLLLLLLALCILPLLKLAAVAVVMKISAALIGMVSEKRIAGCINRVGDGSFLMLQTVFTSVVLFLIVIAVAAYTTR